MAKLKTAIWGWLWRSLLLFTLIFSPVLWVPNSWAGPLAPNLNPNLLGTVLTSDRVDEISVEKISQFIRAYLDVLQLLEARQSDLRHSESEEIPRIQAEIEQDALQRIEAAGLTRQEYLQLLNLANADPDFSDRIAMQLQEFTQDAN